MTMTEDTPRVMKHDSLGEAVCYALLEMEAVGKSGTNKRDGYDFRTVDDVMAAVRTPMARHGVWLKPTFGKPRPVSTYTNDERDVHFVEVDITLSLVHAHSDQRETIEGVGRGRMAGSGNVPIPDPRVIGQALSYGMKALLINAFQLAGGDDSADEAPKADAPPTADRHRPPALYQAPADPETEEARKGLLEDIATLSPDVQVQLKDWCKEQQISVRKDGLTVLRAVAEKVAELVDMEALADPDGSQLLTDEDLSPAAARILAEPMREADAEVDTAEVDEADDPQVSEEIPMDTEEDDPMSSDAYLDAAPTLTLEEEAALAAARQKAATEHLARVHPAGADLPEQERHLAAVPDAPAEAPAEKPKAKRTRKQDVTEVPKGTAKTDEELTDTQLCYLIASGGTADNPDKLVGNRDAQRTALRWAMEMRGTTPKVARKGNSLIDAMTGEVIADGSEAIAHWRSAS